MAVSGVRVRFRIIPEQTLDGVESEFGPPVFVQQSGAVEAARLAADLSGVDEAFAVDHLPERDAAVARIGEDRVDGGFEIVRLVLLAPLGAFPAADSVDAAGADFADQQRFVGGRR